MPYAEEQDSIPFFKSNMMRPIAHLEFKSDRRLETNLDIPHIFLGIKPGFNCIERLVDVHEIEDVFVVWRELAHAWLDCRAAHGCTEVKVPS